MAETHLIDVTGRTVFRGTQKPPGGGSQPPGALSSADFLFTEGPVAGTYTATMAIPAGTVIADCIVYAYDGWVAATAVLTVGDGGDAQKLYNVDLTATGGGLTGGFPDAAGGSLGSSYDVMQEDAGTEGSGGLLGVGGGSAGSGLRYATDDTLTLQVVTTGAPGLGGRTLVKVLYFAPVTAVAATFA